MMFKKLLIIITLLWTQITFAQVNETLNLEPLSRADVETYENIFYEQNRGNWKKSNREIKKIANPILMGHVYYQRYMHATAYISKFSELKNWMENYGDHPGAQRIYDLGVRKNRGKSGGMMRPMTGKAYAFPADKPTPPSRAEIERAKSEKAKPAAPTKAQKRKRQERRDVTELKRIISRYLRQHNAARAEKRLWAFESRGILTDLEVDTELARISNEYYLTNYDEKAFALAQIGSRSREFISQSDWIAGLSAYRLGDCAVAADHFEHVANSSVAGDWTAAAGGYWAARSYLNCRRPEQVSRMLKKAASFKKTFYGIIAARQLGIDPVFDWSAPQFTQADHRDLDGVSAVHRAIALAQVGENTLADQELNTAWGQTRDGQHSALLGLAARLGLAATQLNIGRIEEQKRIASLDSSLYPIPYITPDGGYTLDKALLFGMIRQESAFNSWAKSGVGARGLMQLMMGAAGDMSQNRRLARIKLDDPRYNMFLGQKYMKTMLGKQFADGNLFKSLTAYNAGPGNMQKWIKRTNFQDDPLLYIESIPARETRIYIERVLSNMWIYRMRMGQDIPTLDAVASGNWPIYSGQDNIQTAQNRN